MRNIEKCFTVLVCAVTSVLVLGCGNNKGTTEKAAGNNADTMAVTDSVSGGRGYIVKVGDMVPDFDLLMMDGTTLSIKELRGKVVMLQFTASWCGVCRQEMPHIESEIWQRHKDKAIPVTYPLTLDPDGERFALFCDKGAGVTRNIILDREGRIIMLTRLYDEAEFASMVKLINDELAK